jgi:DNA-binding LytR/AlgR family response regulator
MLIDYSKQTGKKITTKGDKKRFINIEEIMYIQCEDYVSTLFLHNSTKIREVKTLREFEKELAELGFFRIRNNTIINGNYITEVNTKICNRTVKLGKTDFIVAKSRLKSFIS